MRGGNREFRETREVREVREVRGGYAVVEVCSNLDYYLSIFLKFFKFPKLPSLFKLSKLPNHFATLFIKKKCSTWNTFVTTLLGLVICRT